MLFNSFLTILLSLYTFYIQNFASIFRENQSLTELALPPYGCSVMTGDLMFEGRHSANGFSFLFSAIVSILSLNYRFHLLSPYLSWLLCIFQAVLKFLIFPPTLHATSLRTLILNCPHSLSVIFLFSCSWCIFRFFHMFLVCSLLSSDPLLSPFSSLASFLSPHRDVRSAATGSGLGTSSCLVRLCLLCEVFSHIAAFHGLAWHITPLCVCLCVCVFVWGYLRIVSSDFLLHRCKYVCVFCCFFTMCSMCVSICLLSCVCLDWELPLG